MVNVKRVSEVGNIDVPVQQKLGPASFIQRKFADFRKDLSGFFKTRRVTQLPANPLPVTIPVQKAEKVSKIRELLKQPISTFEKIRSLIPIPASINPLIDLLLAKGNKYDVKVAVVQDAVTLATTINLPGQGLKGTAEVSIPIIPQPATDALVELNPAIVDSLSKAISPHLPPDQKMEEIVKLISTLPSQMLNFSWSNGEAGITINLPSGVVLKLKLNIPNSADASNKSDILRTFLKSILKENYPGIETLLSKDMIFLWDGSTSQFKIQFPQQLALQINELALANEALLKLVGKNTTIVIPQTIAGTIDLKNPKIQFAPGTTLEIKKKAPFPNLNVTLKSLSFDPNEKKVKIAFVDRFIPDITIDLNKKPSTGKNVIDFAFIPFNGSPSSKGPALPIPVETSVKPTISVLESLKKMIKIPTFLLPLLNMVLVDKTKLDVTVGIEDKATLSTDFNIAGLGISGKAHLTVPTIAQPNGDTPPVELNPELETLLKRQLAILANPVPGQEPLATPEQLTEILDVILTLPNQYVSLNWYGKTEAVSNCAELTVTLPGGMSLKLELNVLQEEGKQDALRTLLSKQLKTKFPAIESLLNETFTFKWDGEHKEFKLNFLRQQEFQLKSINLKRGGFFRNLLCGIGEWILKGRTVVLPSIISGTLDLANASVTFDKETRFVVQLPFGLSKNVKLGTIAYNVDKNEVDLELKTFGKHHVPIDLNTSNVDDLNFEINMYKRRHRRQHRPR